MAEQETNIVKQHTKQFGKRLWDLVKIQVDKQSNQKDGPQERVAPPKPISEPSLFLKFLFFFPLLLVIGFITSFFWDFNALRTDFMGYEINFEGLLRILSISGLIGFLTNWLAITMLFRPSQRRPILGQGLIPAQKDRIAYRLAVAVSEDLINPEIIKRKIQESKAISRYREQATDYIKNIIDDPNFRSELKLLAVDYVDEMIAQPEVRANIAASVIKQIEANIEENSFEKVALKAYSFIKGQEMQGLIEEALTKLPMGVEKGLDQFDIYLDRLPDKINDHSETIEDVVTSLLHRLINQLDVHALVEDNLRQYDEQRLEKLIKNASNDQLQYIQFLGAILGTFGGFIIWKPIGSLVILSFILGSVVLIDILIHRIKTNENPN